MGFVVGLHGGVRQSTPGVASTNRCSVCKRIVTKSRFCGDRDLLRKPQRHLSTPLRPVTVATAATFELTVREEKNHAVKFPVVESPVNKKALELVRRMETGIKKEACDVIVIGTGPAGLALASQLSNRGLKVTCVGDNPSRRWIPNYGVWLDEFLPLGYPVSCLAKQWSTTSVSLEPEGGKKVLQRPYGRVDRQALQEELLERCLRGGVKFVTGRALSISHDRDDSSLLTYGDGSEQRCRVAVDATGHPSKFIEFARDQTALHLADAASGSTSATRSQGYQAAYGIEAEVAGHPFDLDDMLLMDFRGDHLTPDERANEPPTFLYAMPMSKTRVFLEETSLVARPPLSFDLLKDRLYRRLQHLNVTVTAVEEVPASPAPHPTLSSTRVAAPLHTSAWRALAPSLWHAPHAPPCGRERVAADLSLALKDRRPPHHLQLLRGSGSTAAEPICGSFPFYNRRRQATTEAQS